MEARKGTATKLTGPISLWAAWDLPHATTQLPPVISVVFQNFMFNPGAHQPSVILLGFVFRKRASSYLGVVLMN